MKRLREESSPWELLVEDTERAIVHEADALSQRMLAMTCTRLHRLYHKERGADADILKDYFRFGTQEQLDHCQLLYTFIKDNEARRLQVLAARKGTQTALEWLQHHVGRPNADDVEMTQRVAERGDLSLLQWMHAQGGYTWSSATFAAAAGSGNLEMLTWLQEHQCPSVLSNTMSKALASGSMEMIHWLVQNGYGIDRFSALEIAARHGHLPLMKWLWTEMDCRLTMATMIGAIQHGSLENIQWLLQNQCPYDPGRVLNVAISRQDVALVKWLRKELHCPLSAAAFHTACTEQNPEVLQYLVSEKCPMGPRALHNAFCSVQNPALLQLLLENGCPTDNQCLTFALTSHCQIDVLKLLLNAGCSWPQFAPELAVREVPFPVIQWMLENGHLPSNTCAIFQNAVARGDLAIVRYLYDKQFPQGLDDLLAVALHNRHVSVELLQWLVDTLGCRVTPECWKNARALQQEGVYSWIKKQLMKQILEDFTGDKWQRELIVSISLDDPWTSIQQLVTLLLGRRHRLRDGPHY